LVYFRIAKSRPKVRTHNAVKKRKTKAEAADDEPFEYGFSSAHHFDFSKPFLIHQIPSISTLDGALLLLSEGVGKLGLYTGNYSSSSIFLAFPPNRCAP
jgi:hypothetical protein